MTPRAVTALVRRSRDGVVNHVEGEVWAHPIERVRPVGAEGTMHIFHRAELLAIEGDRALLCIRGSQPIWVEVGQPIEINLYVDITPDGAR